MKPKSAKTLSLTLTLCGGLILMVTLFLRGAAQNAVGAVGIVTMFAGLIVSSLYRCPSCEKRIPMFANGHAVTHCPFCGEPLSKEELP